MNETYKKWILGEELFAFFLAFIIMFGFPFNMYLEYGIAVLWTVAMHLHTKQKNNYYYSQKYLFACGLVWLFSCLYCKDLELAVKYMFLYFTALFVTIFTSTEVFRKMLKYLLILGAVHIAFIMIDSFNHDLVIGIASRYLNSDQIEVNNQLHMFSGACAGLTGQTGQAALFVTIFMFTVVSFAVKKKAFVILLAPAIIALLLTQKRSFLGLGVLFSLGYLFYEFKNIGKWSLIIIVTLVGLSYFAMQFYIDAYFDISGISEKIEEGSMSNRDILWRKMVVLFDANPLFGIGLYSTDKLLGMTGHNMYLQLLCENGLLGAPFFFVLFFRSIYLVLKIKMNIDIVALSKMSILFVLSYGLLGNPIYEIQTLTLLFISMTVLDRLLVKKHPIKI